MFTINDPEVQEQLNTDYANGVVPIWNPNDQTAAQAFVDYWNNLVGSDEAVTLNTHTYYSFTVNPEPSAP